MAISNFISIIVKSMTGPGKTNIRHLLKIALVLVILTHVLCFSAQSETLEIVDSEGVVHRLERPATRIISLYPAHTENLVEIGAVDTLIGISTADTYPEHILTKPRFSYHDTLEKIIEANPDCILIRPMIARSSPKLVKKLQSYGINVISLQPTTVSGLYDYWHTLGEISGFTREAERMIHEFKSELENIKQIVKMVPVSERPRVYFESIHAQMKTFSPASITMFCLESAGGINVAGDAIPRRSTNIAAYGKERILSKAAEIDIFLAQSGRMNRITVSEILKEPGFGAIKAIRNGRVHLVTEHLVSRPTTRLLEGIRQIHYLLFPNNLSADRQS